MIPDANRLGRWVDAIRRPLDLDAPGGPEALGPKFAACIVVAAEVECLMAGLEPTGRNLERIAHALFGAGMLGGLDLIPHPTSLVPATEVSGACRRRDRDQ